MKIHDYFSLDNLDRTLAIFGIFISLFLIIYLIFLKETFVYVFIGILTLMSCILWLIFRRQALKKFFLLSDSAFLLLNIIFFFITTCNVFFIYFRLNNYERPFIFFIFLSLMFGMVAIEILFSRLTIKHKFLIIFQIIILSLFIAWSQLLIFPNVVGIDPWSHQRLTNMIIDKRFIPDGFSYSRLPLMHLEIASTSLITGLNYKLATMFSISFLQIICGILFVYLLGKNIFSVKVGLLSGLFLVLGNYFIGNSIKIIPTSLATILMLIIIYLLFIFCIKNRNVGFFLAIFLMISLLLFHTVTSMCMALILLVSFLINYFYNKIYNKNEIPVTINVVAFFIITMFSWWIYASGHIKKLSDIILAGFQEEIFIHAPEEILRYINNISFSERLFNQLGIFVFFSIAIIGCFFMISKKYGNYHTFNIAIIGMTPLAVGFFSLIFGYFLIPERWWYFSEVLLAVPIAVASILLCMKIERNSLKTLFIFFLIAFLSFIMIMSPIANVDNPIFSSNTNARSAFIESEIITAAFFVEKSVENLSSDYDYFTNPSSSILINFFGLNNTKIKSLDVSFLTKNFTRINTIVIRNEIINKPFRLFGQIFKLDYNPQKYLEEKGFSRILDSNSAKGYI